MAPQRHEDSCGRPWGKGEHEPAVGISEAAAVAREAERLAGRAASEDCDFAFMIFAFDFEHVAEVGDTRVVVG